MELQGRGGGKPCNGLLMMEEWPQNGGVPACMPHKECYCQLAMLQLHEENINLKQRTSIQNVWGQIYVFCSKSVFWSWFRKSDISLTQLFLWSISIKQENSSSLHIEFFVCLFKIHYTKLTDNLNFLAVEINTVTSIFS